MFEQFTAFSHASGLQANEEKSSQFFGGVKQDKQQEILQLLGIVQGNLPIKYLRAPFSSKRTSIVQFQALLEKILGRIQSWTSRFISYARRVQVIKSVMFSIKIFWFQIFMMPEKVVQCTESICRKFLWSGGVDKSRKALIAWETLSWPKVAGGLNFLDISRWNKAICKLLWSSSQKEDKMWTQWVHMYYGQQEPIWGIQPRQAPRMVLKILKITLRR